MEAMDRMGPLFHSMGRLRRPPPLSTNQVRNTYDLAATFDNLTFTGFSLLPPSAGAATFYIEAEDFNYGGGQHKAEADRMSYYGGAERLFFRNPAALFVRIICLHGPEQAQ